MPRPGASRIGVGDHRVGVPVQPGRVLAQEVRVLVPVGVREAAPSPRTIVSGNGGWWITERVFPPGKDWERRSCCRLDTGFRST